MGNYSSENSNILTSVMGIIFIVITSGLLLVLRKFYHKEVLGLSPVFLFISYYLVFRYIADVNLYMRTLRMEIIFYPFLGMLFMTLGAVLYYFMSPISVFSKKVIVRERLLIIAAILGLISVVIYYFLSGDIPLLHGLNLSDSDISMHEARRKITYAHRAGEVGYFGQGYLKYMFLNILPISAFYFYFKNKVTNNSSSYYSILIIIAVVSQILDSRLIPIGRFLIFFFLTKLLVDYVFRKKINIKKIVFPILLIFITVYMLFAFQNVSRHDSSDINAAFSERLFLIPTGKLYTIFPDEMDFRYGQTWLNDLKGLLPGASENFRYEVHTIIYGGAHGFTLSPTLFASIFINFGVLGLILFSMLFGYLFNWVGGWLLQYKNLLSIILYCSYATMIMYSSVSDIVTTLVPTISIFLLFFIFRKKRGYFA